MDDFPETDAEWTPEHWRAFLESLVEQGILDWDEITPLVLGHLNPSQVGTSIASKKSFQRHFAKRECWANVREWHFRQPGRCEDCETRLELQADHCIPKEVVLGAGRALLDDATSAGLNIAELEARCRTEILARLSDADKAVVHDDLVDVIASDLADHVGASINAGSDPSDAELKEIADRLENMLLRCRRCNVVRRPSHAKGGITHQTAEAALMWLLFTRRPSTFDEFLQQCRDYGLTMANIRMEEAWAMARWLARVGLYEIDAQSKYPHAD